MKWIFAIINLFGWCSLVACQSENAGQGDVPISVLIGVGGLALILGIALLATCAYSCTRIQALKKRQTDLVNPPDGVPPLNVPDLSLVHDPLYQTAADAARASAPDGQRGTVYTPPNPLEDQNAPSEASSVISEELNEPQRTEVDVGYAKAATMADIERDTNAAGLEPEPGIPPRHNNNHIHGISNTPNYLAALTDTGNFQRPNYLMFHTPNDVSGPARGAVDQLAPETHVVNQPTYIIRANANNGFTITSDDGPRDEVIFNPSGNRNNGGYPDESVGYARNLQPRRVPVRGFRSPQIATAPTSTK